MRHALLAGGIAAILCGAVGYFVVLRGLSFATDTLTHVGFAGASGAVVIGVSPVLGLLGLTATMAVALGALEQRLRGRDVVIGMILVLSLGLGLLFLRLYRGYSNETYALLFGGILALGVRDIVVVAIGAVIALAALAWLFRPLLFASLDDELAQARGVPVRIVSVAFMLVLAVAVSAANQVIGALLAVALLIAPAATAQRLTRRPAATLLLSVGIALAVTWTGLAIAYWQPYPVSFFITALSSLAYLSARRLTAGA
ncbi:MAG: metal ABC transporter permease [Chloroflexi bacterium]|nr:MAG: metal ABC transporter permease [Chloroflexota bacterium]TMD95381.1 MAG: metal ABC transporter permease [Chloroflexota bacterium]